MTTQEALQTFRAKIEALHALNHAMGVLQYDGETVAPPASAEGRGKTLEYLSGLAYEIETGPELNRAADFLAAHSDELSAQDRRAVEVFRRETEFTASIPQAEYVGYVTLLNRASAVWHKAKAENDYASFAPVVQEIFDTTYASRFKEAGLEYFYTLIDDVVARVMRSEGGFIWACKNYDGDVMSDMLSSAFGSLAMMTSVLVSPHGQYEYEAAHGTVQRHYYKYLRGEETSTNSVATIFAWTGALAKRGELDGTPELVDFAKRLERATVKTIEDGRMTGDLARITTLVNPTKLNTRDFILAIRDELEAGA